MNEFTLLEGRARHSVRAGSGERSPSDDGAQGTDAPYHANGRDAFHHVPFSPKMLGALWKASLPVLAAAIFLLPRPAGAGWALYTADGTHNTILKVNTNGVATVFATNGVNGVLSVPSGMVMDNLGNLYVVNNGATTNTIERFNPQGSGSLFASIIAHNPIGLATDVSNNLYLAQNGGGGLNVLKFTNPQAQSSVFVSGGVGEPLGLAFDNAGNLFVGDFYSSHIYKVDRLGNVALFATAPASSNPVGLAFDAAGNLYVALYSSGIVVRYDTNANPTTFATLPYPNNTPYGLAFDSSGNLYVGSPSASHATIFKVDPQGHPPTVFANAASGLTGNGFIIIQDTRYQDNWFKAASGGGTSTNAEFAINGTVGQQDAGTATIGGKLGLVGGFWARISLVPTPGAPELAITLTTTNTAMVYWPYPSTGWNLQQNTNLATTNWATPAETVNNDGSIKYIIINPPTGNRFYRLMQ